MPTHGASQILIAMPEEERGEWLRSLVPNDGVDVIQFIPLIISSGGNSGSRATLVIRAMAFGEVGLRHWWRILVRECHVRFHTGNGVVRHRHESNHALAWCIWGVW